MKNIERTQLFSFIKFLFILYQLVSAFTSSEGDSQITGVGVVHGLELEALDGGEHTVNSNLPLSEDTKEGSEHEPDFHEE